MEKFWTEPKYLFDGDTVWLPLGPGEASGSTKVFRCTVLCAAGNMARVGCESRNVDKWVRLSDLLVPPESPRSWNCEKAHLGGGGPYLLNRDYDPTQPITPDNCPNHPSVSQLEEVWCRDCGADKSSTDALGLIAALRASEKASEN